MSMGLLTFEFKELTFEFTGVEISGAVVQRLNEEMLNHKAAALLEEAAEVLEKQGWVKGSYKKIGEDREVIGFCAVGGIRQAAGWYEQGTYEHSVELDLALRALSEEITAQYGHVCGIIHDEIHSCGPECKITHFNDHFSRDVQQVLDVMHAAAKKLRTEGEQA